jgi:hypothetical protein
MAELVAVDLAAVRDRIGALGLFTAVSDVADAAEAMEVGTRTPAAFVAVSRETATPNRTQGVHDQAVEVDLAVLFVISAQRADQRRNDAVEELRLAVMGTLSGWQPPGASKALDYSGFRVVHMAGGLVWCECSFRTGWRLRIV